MGFEGFRVLGFLYCRDGTDRQTSAQSASPDSEHRVPYGKLLGSVLRPMESSTEGVA